MRGLRRGALAAAFVCPVLGACFLPGFEKTDPGGTGGAGGVADDPCSARWPSEPPASSTPDDSVVISLAVRTIDLGEQNVAFAPGFDLDRACTCCSGCPEAQTCSPPGETLCDAERGRDNAVAHFVARLEQQLASPVTTTSLQTEIDAGNWTVLIRITGYNGQPDDDDVTVAMYATSPLTAAPSWNGGDTWTVRTDYLLPMSANLEDALVKSDVAYVHGGVLVGTFGAGGPLRLSLTGGFDIHLTSAVVSGPLELVDGRYRLSATMGGLWTMPDVFRSLSALRAGGMPVVCKGDASYEMTVKPLLCGLRDSRPGLDTPSPCDALSFGAAYVAEQVVISQTSPPPDPGTPCPVGFGPEDDVCP